MLNLDEKVNIMKKCLVFLVCKTTSDNIFGSLILTITLIHTNK